MLPIKAEQYFPPQPEPAPKPIPTGSDVYIIRDPVYEPEWLIPPIETIYALSQQPMVSEEERFTFEGDGPLTEDSPFYQMLKQVEDCLRDIVQPAIDATLGDARNMYTVKGVKVYTKPLGKPELKTRMQSI